MTEYILFFSKNCSYCIDLLNKLYKNNDLYNEMKLININNEQLNIPKFIKSVPSLIISENETHNLLVGNEVFEWYESIIKKMDGDILDWDPTTMSGYSDDFSFIEEKETVNNDRSYCYISNVDRFKIDTPNDDTNTSSKLQKSNTDVALEKMLSQRKMDIQSPITRR